MIKEGEGSASLLEGEPERETKKTQDEADNQDSSEEEELSSVEVMKEGDKAEVETEIKTEDSGCVISDQPVSHGDRLVSQTPEVSPFSQLGLGVPCCQGQHDITAREEGKDEEVEPNNNTNKPRPPLPKPDPRHSPVSSARRNKMELQRGGREGERGGESGRDDLLTDRCQPHSAAATREESAPRVEQGKRHSVKLRERLFQFPLCEKALAFNIPTHNKPKILPLAQYNCCHVL